VGPLCMHVLSFVVSSLLLLLLSFHVARLPTQSYYAQAQARLFKI